jgi:hypothetical protein
MARQKLIENILVPASKIIKLDIPLSETTVEGTPYKALAVYRFPFTRPGQKNLNGRIYPFKLWDRIFQLFKTKATVSLCNHPEDDGDPARIWAVLRNPGYSEDRTLGLVDCYILDNELGRTANGVLLAGGDLGLSSSGIGDFEADGVTVEADTYELERFFDWVLNPSYSVFGTLDDKISEGVMADPINTEQGSEKVHEKAGGAGVKTLSLREKREFEASLKRIYEDVKGIKSVAERLSRAKEALTFYEDTDVESYKGNFEELVKEAEKEFEATLAKGEQADAVKKEAEETSKKADEVKKEAEDLKKENETLKKENEELKKKAEETQKLKDESTGLLASMAESMRRNIPYEKYEELRQYAVKATKLYSEMKNDRNLLQIQLQEMRATAKTLDEAQMVQYQKDAAARARIEETRQRNADAKALSEKKLLEAKEAEFMRNVNPDVLDYYNDLVGRGEKTSEQLRLQILSKRTIVEAQMFFLKAKRNTAPITESAPIRDLSTPLPVKNFRQVMPDVPLNLPKGFI